MILTPLPVIFAGLILLIIGGELLVRGAVKLAMKMGVSPLVVGLTIVGFGTSTPELVTSVQAALSQAPGIAYGNIVGSNIANLLLIGGTSALILPVVVSSSSLKRDTTVMLLATIAFCSLAALGPMGRSVGVVFISLLALYLIIAIHQERRASQIKPPVMGTPQNADTHSNPRPTYNESGQLSGVIALLTAILGIGIVVFGGKLLVDGSVTLARSLEIEEAVIGLTIVAVGTSMPELVTSVIAAIKRQGDVAFGNIVGSNIYNILGIGGATAMAAPGVVPDQIVKFDNILLLGVTVLFVGLAYTGLRIARREGALLLGAYCLYIYAIWP